MEARGVGLLEFFLKPVASRFIGGETLDEALEAAKQLNHLGFHVIVNYLGEDLVDEREIEKARAEYISILKRLDGEGVLGSVSVKLTQLGLLRGSAYENLSSIISEAKRLGRFVWIDMEGSAHTQATIDVYLRLLESYENLGLALQAYLKRTPEDLRRVLEAGGKVRLCKGAYNEPGDIAYRGKSAVRAKFAELMDVLFKSENYFAIATHDDVLVRKALSYGRSPETFEFQLLKGVRGELGKKLKEDGYRVSIYLPYGSEWLAYSIRRIRERERNLILLGRALLSR